MPSKKPPVMTNNKLTGDQLRDRAARKVKSLKLAIEQSAFTNIRYDLEEELQLAEFALNAMTQRPVAEFAENFIFNLRGQENGDRWPVGTKLYTAPQPLTDAERAELQEYRKAAKEAVTVPNGWQLVPIEPTEDMVIEGFESEPDPFFGTRSDWDAYRAMSGCQQAAHRARLCWAAMLKATPKVGGS